MICDYKRSIEAVKDEYEANMNMKEVYAKIGRLSTYVEWYKRGLVH